MFQNSKMILYRRPVWRGHSRPPGEVAHVALAIVRGRSPHHIAQLGREG